MKKTVHAIMAAAVVATALAANADTVVWYTFDNLGGVGTTLADSSTIQNKANPGTLNATVYGMRGQNKDATSVNKPYVTNGVPETLRVLDPVGRTIATSADKALRFPCTNAGGQGAVLETPNNSALRPSSFTVEMFVRLTEGRDGWQTLACQPSTTSSLYGWSIIFKQYSYLGILLSFVKPDGTEQKCEFNGGTVFYDWKWHHIAMTVYPHATDSSKTVVRFYLDYAKIYDNDAPFVLSLSDSADCPVQIGGTTVTARNFMGEIGEFRFSSGAMDPGEFLRPHNAEIDKDVVLYYDFEDANAYDGNFGTAEANLLNKASPILPGSLATRTFTEKGTLPEVDGEAAPASGIRQSMSGLDWSENASSLYNNYEGDRCGNYLYCDLPSSMSLADTNFTVEMFCKTDGSVSWWTSVFRDNNDQVWIGGGADGNKFLGRVTQDDGSTQMTVSDNASVNDGKWHHIALVREGTALTLYRDKRAVASETLTSDSLKAIGDRWQFIGGPHGGANVFNGWLDSVRVTRRALEPEEFLTSQRYPEGSTIAHLKFDDGTANAVDGGCALFEGQNTSLTFSDDVPGYKITDGEGGSVLSKPDVKSLSVPSAAFTWSNWDDLYYLRKDASGNERTSGTVELWVKTEITTAQPFKTILNAKLNQDVAWRLGFPSDGKNPSVLFYPLKGNTRLTADRKTFTVDGGNGVTDGKWHHWAFTFQPNASDSTKSDIDFYLDYKKVGSTQTLGGRVAYDDSLNFSISQGGSNFAGLIDEVRISDCVLDPSEFLRAENQPGLTIIFR